MLKKVRCFRRAASSRALSLSSPRIARGRRRATMSADRKHLRGERGRTGELLKKKKKKAEKPINGIKSVSPFFLSLALSFSPSYLRRLGVHRVRGRRRQVASVVHGERGRESLSMRRHLGRREREKQERWGEAKFFSSLVGRRRKKKSGASSSLLPCFFFLFLSFCSLLYFHVLQGAARACCSLEPS